jgi:hypothetical protein
MPVRKVGVVNAVSLNSKSGELLSVTQASHKGVPISLVTGQFQLKRSGVERRMPRFARNNTYLAGM